MATVLMGQYKICLLCFGLFFLVWSKLKKTLMSVFRWMHSSIFLKFRKKNYANWDLLCGEWVEILWDLALKSNPTRPLISLCTYVPTCRAMLFLWLKAADFSQILKKLMTCDSDMYNAALILLFHDFATRSNASILSKLKCVRSAIWFAELGFIGDSELVISSDFEESEYGMKNGCILKSVFRVKIEQLGEMLLVKFGTFVLSVTWPLSFNFNQLKVLLRNWYPSTVA